MKSNTTARKLAQQIANTYGGKVDENQPDPHSETVRLEGDGKRIVVVVMEIATCPSK